MPINTIATLYSALVLSSRELIGVNGLIYDGNLESGVPSFRRGILLLHFVYLAGSLLVGLCDQRLIFTSRVTVRNPPHEQGRDES